MGFVLRFSVKGRKVLFRDTEAHIEPAMRVGVQFGCNSERQHRAVRIAYTTKMSMEGTAER